MLVHRKAIAVLFAVGLTMVGCAHSDEVIGEDQRDDVAMLRVENNNWNDVGIYVLRGPQRQRLGTVSSNSVALFRLPDYVLFGGSEVRLLADPIGSRRTHTSQPLFIAPGDTVEWRLDNNGFSSAFIRGD